MPTVPHSRRVAAAAVNALRSLLEDHEHIVEEIDQRNDFGEDLYVRFTDRRQVTGDVVKVQVKGGTSWRSPGGGYRVPVGKHAATWADGNIPVLCVVHDPERQGLYWTNATRQLLAARRNRLVLKTIVVDEEDRLDDTTVTDFVQETRRFLNRYRGNLALRARLGEMAGVEFDSFDVVMHFINELGEDLIFWQRRGEGFATLLHSDLGWAPEYVGPEMLCLDVLPGHPGFGPVPRIGETILDLSEITWLTACFSATAWARQEAPDGHADIRAEVADNYVSQRIIRRLDTEDGLLIRAEAAFQEALKSDPGLVTRQDLSLEDAAIRDEAVSACGQTWWDMSHEARVLVLAYLIGSVFIGAPSMPIAEQIRIVWRIPLPHKAT
ncbi:DUF4365 domain-containing protein [Actinoplanes sp. NBRC 101535]|uniref:DUF4365 domain-containing protein n=1 Tax=Actinoplanes sp. NBRC 101535 TaxID=3032196 RepID=UPI0024A4214D|nr:DUF4365 domain-containing protein [Actinoplanes sp. NBRC 101535]GLY06297.1 hypothetical protein Acsp01_66760 [Actinoplanes sp. NBRC 101535]